MRRATVTWFAVISGRLALDTLAPYHGDVRLPAAPGRRWGACPSRYSVTQFAMMCVS